MNILSLFLGKQYEILTYLPEAVLVIDETGKIHYANKRAFRLFETQRLRGKNINDFFIINSDNIIANKDEEIKQILKVVSEEQNTKITDVKVTDVSSTKKKRYILTIIDNTQDHSLLDQLITERQEQKILNHTKNVLLSKMSNYLCSPLHSVVGFSQAMLEGLSGEINDKQIKYLQIMNGNSSELLLFIEKLIELSQIESDVYEFNYQNFDLISMLNVLVNEFNVKLSNRDIKLHLNMAEYIKSNCYSDKNVFKIIIYNLIENAINLMTTGAIIINVDNPGPEFLIAKGMEVNDKINEKSYLMVEITCKGLDASIYSTPDIIDPYIQVDKNSKKYLMQSLILSSTKKFINKLKGEMWINNQISNQVSFIFIVPVEKSILEDNGTV